ncbi:methyltransferase domain-containing protein [Halopseudomonas pelagia]|uniref:methyltransferase domain-containing protein n=1 Tax=Halopseudomonas pelagia TaxID=553151 RepID=UPI00039EB6B1|nr:methyltransferase domain-containing protein [Halopseudomonas pelagia]|tara:strand:+ start:192005 stop:192781 length:777 start_codon:yes stop_codon:yes gene_type:complete
MTDRYFDQMGAHFARKIYTSPKGSIRLAVLTRDLQEWLPDIQQPEQSLRILDAGAGLGHISEWLLAQGHRLTLCEPSIEMLEAARAHLDALPSAYPVEYLQLPLQALPARGEQYDLVICHAVLEWLADPAAALKALQQLCLPSGALSLAFYNRDALVYKNLIKGQFRKLEKNQLAGSKRSLTPQQPLDPREVQQWINQAGLTTHKLSGIRVFYDYMPVEFQAQATEAQIIEAELQYSRHPAYAALGRYLHHWLRPTQD